MYNYPMRFFKNLLLICIILSTVTHARFEDPLLYNGLKTAQNVRPLSMGGAFTAVADGPEGVFYNPASAAKPGGQLLFEEQDQEKVSFQSFRSASLYLSPFVYTNTRIEDLNNNSLTIQSFTMATKSRIGIDYGVTYKAIDIDNIDTGSGWSADFGALAHILPNLNWGITFKDFVNHNINTPGTIMTGLAYRPFNSSLLIASDIHQVESLNGNTNYIGSLGTEVNISDSTSVRAGIRQNTLSTGINLQFPIVKLAYSYLTNTETKEERHALSASIGIGSVNSALERRRYAIFKKEAYAVFALNGSITSGQSEVSLLGGQKLGMNDLLTLVEHAKKDPSCKGFIIKIQELGSGLTTIGLLQELRQSLAEAKKDGKEIYIYLEGWASLPEYYLASVSDNIFMPELGSISHLGLELEIVKTNELFSKFGLGTQTITSGEFKGSLNPSTPTLNIKERSQLEGIIQSIYRQAITEIKESRKLTWDQIDTLFDGQIISAQKAKEENLVDSLGYFDTVEEFAEVSKKENQMKNAAVPLYVFSYIPDPTSIFSYGNRIAVIEIDGGIQNGSSGTGFLFGGKSTGAKDIKQIIKRIKKDKGIGGIVIRINSPGGSLIGSDHIYHMLTELKEDMKKVPIYASIGSIATSGGYYIALAADRIYANPSSLTGSIGVISQYKNFEEFNKLFGIQTETIKTGKYADFGNKNRVLTEDEIKMIQENQKIGYAAFTDKVKTNRKLSDEEITVIAQGQIFTGEEAQNIGLVDNIGNFYTVINDIAKVQKIDNPEILIYRKDAPPILKQLFNIR